MKIPFKLISALRLLRSVVEERAAGGYRRSSSYYPFYQRQSDFRSAAERLLARLLPGRR